MKFDLKKEAPQLIVIFLPIVYLFMVWADLPEQVPVHWNIKGEADRYGDKIELLFMSLLLPVVTYIIFLVVPKIDPKRKIEKMGKKYNSLKFLLVLLMSLLSLYIIYTAKNESFSNPNIGLILIGIILIVFGNYAKTLKANYFIGIRTPWTLEDETIWNETHRLGGKFSLIGGILIVFLGIALDSERFFGIFTFLILVIAFVPIIYSYILFRRKKNNASK